MKDLRHLNKYFYKYRFRFVLGVIFVVASNLFSVFPAKAVQRAIDTLVKTIHVSDASAVSSMFSSEVGKIILYCTFLVFLFAVIRGIFMFFMRQTLIVMSRKIEFDLKNEIFAHYQQLDESFYRKNNTGDMMARISEDVSRVRMYIGPAIMYFINLIATFMVVLPAMFSVNAHLALYVLLPLPVLSFCIFYVNTLIHKRSDAIQSQLSVITSFTQEAFNGIRVIKAFGVEKYANQALETHVDEYRKRSMDLAKVDATFFPLMVFLTGLSTIVTISVGGYMAIQHMITIGNIAEYIFYVNLLVWPVTALGFTTSLIQRAAASQKRINEFLQTRPEIVSESKEDFVFNNSIVFDQVSFVYPGKEIPAVKDISFDLRKGRSLGILGTTGSGKSTIARLLLRMQDMNQGEITIDGVPLNRINLESFRSKIGYVPQDVFLFSDTIRNNILFGAAKPADVTEAQLMNVIEDAGLTSTIQDFPSGLETMLGERGITLSGGQKQRVSIARALIKNPEIIILDDCLSAVDTKTEAFILNSLRNIMHNKTMVMISHRVSTVKDMQQILILEEGVVIEQGTHDSLMDTGGKYDTLYQKQKSEELHGA